MSNPERRAQVRIGDGAVPSTAPLSDAGAAALRGEIALDPTAAFPGSRDDELTHPDWSNPNLLEPSFASSVQPRAVERATDIDDADADSISLPGEPDDENFADMLTEQVPHPSFGTGDAPTEDTPFPLERNLPPGRAPWDADTTNFAGDDAVIDRVPTASQPPHIERVIRPSFEAQEQSPHEPIASGSISDPANMIAARASEPRSETIAIAPRRPGPSSNWLGRAAQAIASTAKRWGQRLGLLGAVASSTIYAPESQKPITVPQSAPPVPEQIVPAPQPVEAQVPLVTNGTPRENLPVSPVAEESRVQTTVTPEPAVADVTPPRVSVRLPDVGTPRRPSVQTRDAEPAKPLVPLKVTLDYGDSVAPAVPTPAAVTAEPTPTPPPASVVDAPQPVADSMTAVQQPPSSVEISNQLNQDISRGPLSPEKQIEYIKNLFDRLDTSKIFIRLSLTKGLELRQYSTGEIQARFPGEKDFRPLTVDEIKGLGDLTKKPHYSR